MDDCHSSTLCQSFKMFAIMLLIVWMINECAELRISGDEQQMNRQTDYLTID